MLPRLNITEAIEQNVIRFLEELNNLAFTGEIRCDYATRLTAATDNSIYQVLPQAVLFPRHHQDVVQVFQLARRSEYHSLVFSPRGGGTGTNGQSLTSGIVLDLSKYMNRIGPLNLEEGWVEVEPGVVLDELNEYLRPYGVFFSPSLSPSNRATLGGMINTDACGKGSRIYGRTSEHIIELTTVLQNAEVLVSRALTPEKWETAKNSQGSLGALYREIDHIITSKKELIQSQFPRLKRFMTGYNLAKIHNPETDRYNINYLIAGSEGTLGVVTRARLKLTPIPKHKELLVIKYGDFDSALSAAQILLSTDPSAIETLDEQVLSLAKDDLIYHEVKDFIADEPAGVTRAVNLVEYVDHDPDELRQRVESLLSKLTLERDQPNAAANQITSPLLGWYRAKNSTEMTSLWNLRKKGVGLLGKLPGNRKPIAFVEDTVVPPENLAAYVKEFRKVLDDYGLSYGMFGHVDVGCLHVRPALDMKDVNDERLVQEISDKVAVLVRKYGGVMWGEHGRGFRAEYTPMFFGELYTDLRRVKEAFDPHNRLNPGKIVSPLSHPDKTVKVKDVKRGYFDRGILAEHQHDYEDALNCNGNGACFNYHPDSVMCPSSKITRDRIHSPKGRAAIMREWLRQLSLYQQSPLQDKGGFEIKARSGLQKVLYFGQVTLNWWRRCWNTLDKRKGLYDFSHEVYDAMNGCLACKACATECPVKVDVPDFKSRFVEIYHTRYLRPLKDYFVASVEYVAMWQSRFPLIWAELMQFAWTKALMRKVIGMVDAPAPATTTLNFMLTERNAPTFDESVLSQLSAAEKKRTVLLLQDCFTTFYDPKVVADIYDLLRMLGYVVYVLPYHPNGKPLHVKGFLRYFHRLALKNAEFLRKINRFGIPIVGVEPSIVLTYRDEYQRILKRELDFKVWLLQEWLVEQLPKFNWLHTIQDQSSHQQYQLYGHCTERTAVAASQEQWQTIFEAFGLKLNLMKVGCCGMAGTFGHEVEHLEESKGIYTMSWQKQMPTQKIDHPTVLATGYSCRTQVSRFDGFKPHHPAQALLEELSRSQAAAR